MKPKRCLVLNGAGAGKGLSNLIAVLEEGRVIAQQPLAGRGASERFAPALHALLAQAGWSHPPDLLVAVVGPGSFTGLRASLALAAGLARGWSCQHVGVRLGDAMRASVQRVDMTVLCLARRGRVFVDPPGKAAYALPVDEMIPASWPVIAGDAVFGDDALPELSGTQGKARLGTAIERLPLAAPTAEGIFRAAIQALQNARQGGGGVQPYALEPLYIDPPEARPPAGGLRLAPY